MPEAGAETPGMSFPAGLTPFDDDAWGVTVEYEEDGYVSDADADELDYDALLSEMQESIREASKERVARVTRQSSWSAGHPVPSMTRKPTSCTGPRN
jgi:hypothetical protein